MAFISPLIAAVFHGTMESGRTRPLKISCADESGRAAGDYAVKLSGAVTTSALAREWIAAKLATLLDLYVPETAWVEINSGFAKSVASIKPDLASVLHRSIGVNFGSRLLTGGYRTWPTDWKVPDSLSQLAMDIFCFDALIQNPDRRFDNPNLLWRDENIFILDHELAFSFLDAIGNQLNPWEIHDLNFMRNHVFYRGLKGQGKSPARFMKALQGMDLTKIAAMNQEIPPHWHFASLPDMVNHLQLARSHAEEFALHVQEVLA